MAKAPQLLGYNSLLGDGSVLTNYQPTLREQATDWLRKKLFTDDREGQGKAERLMNWGETMLPPVGFATGAYDMGRAGGQGDYATAGLNGLAIFAGPMARTADHAALKVAHELEIAGADAGRIWKETGWGRGADGKWRFEIPDNNMTVADNGAMYVGSRVNHPELLDAYPQLKGQMFLERDDLPYGVRAQYWTGRDELSGDTVKGISINNALKSDPQQVRSTVLHELQHGVQDIEGFARGSNPDVSQAEAQKFADKIKYHPENQAARIGSNKWDAARNEAAPVWKAQYVDTLDRLIQRPSLKPRDIFRMGDWYGPGVEYARSVGSMPKKPGPKRDEWLRGAAVAMKEDYLAKLTPEQKAGLEWAQTTFPTPRDRKNAAARAERKMSKYTADARQWSETDQYTNDLYNLNKTQAYERSAGETEARNTQTRRDMTAEERRNKFPWDTVDVPFAQQIVPNADANALISYLRTLKKGGGGR